jgi:hypothetical protein
VVEPVPEPEPEPEPEPDPVPLPEPPPVVPPSLVPVKGLLSELTVALVKSKPKVVVSSCWAILAFVLVVASEPPDFQPPIQPEDVLESDIWPPLHVWQLAHRTLAIMFWPSLESPLPARRVNCAAVLLVSSVGVV